MTYRRAGLGAVEHEGPADGIGGDDAPAPSTSWGPV